MKTDAKVLFSNDLTNILHCDSPFHKRGDFRFTAGLLESSVAETAGTGVDVHLLQPAFGWFPLWKSKFLPIEKHVAWLRKTYGELPADTDVQKWVCELSRYQREDGDIVGEFIRNCRKYGQQAFISMRMNDSHHGAFSPCEFYHLHPEYRINCKSNSWADRCHNWMIPEVRDFKYNLYRDLLENYAFDGFELDFMRYGRLYDEYETTESERIAVTTEFVRKIRRISKDRLLCVRIPVDAESRSFLGIDPRRLAEIGVDMFNYSSYFYTSQETDCGALKELTPDVPLYLEMTNCSGIGRAAEKTEGDSYEMFNCTPSELRTTALCAYEAGWQGVSLFNFVYYRRFGSDKKKTAVSEPPFDVIRDLRDPERLRKSDKTYFFASRWEPAVLPQAIAVYGQNVKFTFPNVSPDENAVWELEFTVETSGTDCGDWETWFNGQTLSKPEIRGKLFRWQVPASMIRKGSNCVKIRSCDLGISTIMKIKLCAQIAKGKKLS